MFTRDFSGGAGVGAAALRVHLSRRLRLCPFLALALTVTGCAASPGEDVGASLDPIQRGQAAPDDYEAVGMLVFEDGLTCNGTLVDDDLVLTTTTCLTRHGTPTAFHTGRGKAAPTAEGAVSTMTRHEVSGAKTFPDYLPRRGFADMDLANPCRLPGLDVGLVKLRRGTGITPLSLDPRAPRSAESCTIVGYGRDDSGAVGERRSAKASYVGDRLEAFTFQGESGSMGRGDAGAPLVCGDKVLGVGACTGDVDFFGRVDQTIAWIGRMRASWENDTCLAPREIGTIVGDRGTPSLSASGTCSESVQILVNEVEGSITRVPLKLKATLTSPPGEDFDLFLYESYTQIDPFAPRYKGRVSCGLSTARSEESGREDVVNRAWGDESNMSVNDGRWVTLEVRNKGEGCAREPWQLRIEGNAQ